MANISINDSKEVLHKPLEDLNMMDAFLFEAATEKTENAEMIAKTIIRRTLGLDINNIVVETEKAINGLNQSKHGIRMDIYAKESVPSAKNPNAFRLFNIEPNNYTETDLPRRSRYYQSLTDAKLLPTKASYTHLPDVYSIWILPYDPFGADRMIYTVKNSVVENRDIMYNDGITKIFLYINGKFGGTEELRSLLRFLANTNTTNAIDEELSDIQQIIDEIKQNAKVGEKYMHFLTYEEYAQLAAERGYENGFDLGYDSGYGSGYDSGYDSGLEKGKYEGEIFGAIKTLKSLSYNNKQVKISLIKDFHLTDEQADTYLSQYEHIILSSN